MFSAFRSIAEALQRLTGIIARLEATLGSAAPAIERLEALERSRALWEADLEGILAKAEGKLKAASNAESRSRTMKKHYENEVDPFPDDREEVQPPVRDGYAPTGEEEGVPAVRVDMETDYKTTPLNRKWGVV